MLSDLIEIRRYLHAHPEPSFKEEHTADLIERTCLGWGITNLHRPIRTCVCVHLGTGKGPAIALRADIDCVAQDEQNAVPWRSTVPGLMHACGHDVHTTILLGTARSLAREQLPGTCILLFQPAEEAGSPSGAAVLVDQEGWIEKHSPDEIYAFHVWPWLETGKVGCKPGPIMAAATSLEITVKGRGGHGGMPHTSVDAIVIASHIITALQTIVARQVDPADQVVITLGGIQGGSRTSIIADRVEVVGTVRTLTNDMQGFVKRRVTDICEQVAAALGGCAEVRFKEGLSPTINNDTCVRHMADAVGAALGPGAYVPVDRCPMTAEDFGRFLERIPGAFAFLGCTSPGAKPHPLHSPHFLPDESAVKHGVDVLTRLVLDFFRRRR